MYLHVGFNFCFDSKEVCKAHETDKQLENIISHSHFLQKIYM